LPVSVAYAYDSASRLREISQASQAATFAYTPNTSQIASITSSANGVTRLTSTKDYDQLGRLASVSHAIGSTALSHSYLYNGANQRTRANREDGSYWDYAYDTLGQINNAVKRRSDGAARLGQTFAYTYDDIGNRRSATLNNQTATYTADVLNRYVTRTVPSVVPVLGRAAADATVLVNREPTTRQDGWFYTEVAAANTTAPQYVKLDVSGIKPPAGTGPEIAAFEQRNAFLAQTPETFAYDSDGNLTQDGRWTYAWDAENRLVVMEARSEVATLSPALRLRLEFAYDGSGRRIRKQVKTRNDSTWTTTTDRRFLYDGWNLIAEFDANATNSTLALVRSYTWGLDLSGSMQGAGGVGGLLWTTFASPATTHAFLADGNGNLIASVDAATGLVSHADDYSPFGETIPLAGSRPGAFGFSSKYTDVETGLLYYGFRYYNPQTGRWPNRDPIDELGFNRLSKEDSDDDSNGLQSDTNLYGFVANNPTNDIDVLGLFLAAIDGTDSKKSVLFDEKFQSFNSHVRNFYEAYSGSGGKQYWNGPNLLGGGVSGTVDEVYQRISQALKANPGEEINLVGHSRGGLIAILVAKKLKKEIPCAKVNFLGLYDAVDRYLFANAGTIPDNVEYVAHARRNPAVHSRDSFGNTGTSGGQEYVQQFFWVTHSGAGGDPWGGPHPKVHGKPTITKKQDEEGSRQVGNWMRGQFR
jgi:RHS repeat-associated protein